MLGGGTTRALVLAQDAHLPIDPRLTVVEPLTLGGTCVGTMRFDAAKRALVLAQDSRIGPNGCTVSILVQALKPGTIQNSVPSQLMKTTLGTTNLPGSALLVVSD